MGGYMGIPHDILLWGAAASHLELNIKRSQPDSRVFSEYFAFLLYQNRLVSACGTFAFDRTV